MAEFEIRGVLFIYDGWDADRAEIGVVLFNDCEVDCVMNEQNVPL